MVCYRMDVGTPGLVARSEGEGTATTATSRNHNEPSHLVFPNVSNSVMEHNGEPAMAAIFMELRRLAEQNQRVMTEQTSLRGLFATAMD